MNILIEEVISNPIIQINNDSSDLSISIIESVNQTVIEISEVGERGLKGENGIQGIQGERGIQGEKGDIGLTGSKGDAGTNGVDGKNGVDGFQGLQGVKGNDGSIGPQGETGIKGDSGNTNVFIQQNNPALSTPYLWYQTDETGSLVSIWINKI